MIRVVNKYKHTPTPTETDVYIGRGSCVGNPYSHMDGTMAKFKVPTRDVAIRMYSTWLSESYTSNSAVKSFIDGLVDRIASGESINLVCYCHPKPCHGDYIMMLVKELAKSKYGWTESNRENVL